MHTHTTHYTHYAHTTYYTHTTHTIHILHTHTHYTHVHILHMHNAHTLHMHTHPAHIHTLHAHTYLTPGRNRTQVLLANPALAEPPFFFPLRAALVPAELSSGDNLSGLLSHRRWWRAVHGSFHPAAGPPRPCAPSRLSIPHELFLKALLTLEADAH